MTYGVEIVGQLPAQPEPGATAVYRFFTEDDVLLYIGICDEPVRRWHRHADKPWWPQVTRFSVMWFASREEATEAEGKAIVSEKPLHNVVLNGVPYNGSMFPRVHLHRLACERFGDRPFSLSTMADELGISRGSGASKARELRAQGLFVLVGKMKDRSGRAVPHYRAVPSD